MKLRYIIVLTILFSGCYDVNRNCKDFKTGTFSSTVELGGKSYVSNFIRTDDLQIETFEDKTDSASIRWINDCEVIFHTLNPKRQADKKDIHLKILTTTDSSYTFEYSYVGEANKQRGTATKIK